MKKRINFYPQAPIHFFYPLGEEYDWITNLTIKPTFRKTWSVFIGYPIGQGNLIGCKIG